MNINLSNVEEIIFRNEDAKNLLPRHNRFFAQWKVLSGLPNFRNILKNKFIDFLNEINEEEVNELSILFKTNIIIDRIKKNIVKHVSCLKNEISDCIVFEKEYKSYTIAVNKDQAHITFWR